MSAGADLQAIRANLLKAGFDADTLDALGSAESPRETARPDPVAKFRDPELLLHAALSGTFLPGQLARKRNTEAVGDLLSLAETVVTAGGRAWRLRADVRRETLTSAAAQDRLDAAIRRIEPSPEDANGAMLRRVLSVPLFSLDTMPIDQLDSLAQVVEWLEGSDLASGLPALDEIRRVKQRRELIEPFLTLVGRPLDTPDDGSRDRFVGREKEIERLRAYVGIVPPDQMLDYFGRGASAVLSKIGLGPDSNEPLRIEGEGGAGKSTLIAKFILDHAFIPEVRLPFMYLDFDRATITAREPLQMLIDLALQMSTWFPEADPALLDFRQVLRRTIDQQARNPEQKSRERTTWSELRGHCQKFRSIIGSVNPHGLPVVLLLDTFELVQYNAEAVQGVLGLIESMRRPLGPPWENLRIVVAGRGTLRQIKTGQKALPVGQLSLEATRQLIALRNELEGLGLTDAQVKALARPLRSSPLDVVVVTRWMKQNPKKVDQFIREVLEDPEVKASGGGEARITALLMHRMIAHIADRQVRELALPGFVARTITPEVIRDVMLPARRGRTSADDDDKSESATKRAEILFQRLQREQWLVYRQGKALRHRADVRRGMLQLIRERDPDGFYRTNQAAIAYYWERAIEKFDRAEAMYHLLLAEPPRIEGADTLWRPDLAPLLATGMDDLSEPAQDYLRIRLGHSYSATTLLGMPQRTLELVMASAGQQILDRIGPESLLAVSRERHQVVSYGLVAEAEYRAGRWPSLAGGVRSHEPMSVGQSVWPMEPSPPQRQRLRQLVLLGTRDAALDPQWGAALEKIEAENRQYPEPLFWEMAALEACCYRRLGNPSGVSRILGVAAQRCVRSRESLSPEVRGGAALRILALLEPVHSTTILSAVDLSAHFSTVSAREFELFRRMVEHGGAETVGVEPNQGDLLARGRKLVEQVQQTGEGQIVIDPTLTSGFGEIAQGLIRHGPAFQADPVRMLLALSHPDWLEPLGLALGRAYGGDVPTKLGLFSSIDKLLGEESGGGRRTGRGMTGHQILSLADEASQLPEAVDAYRQLLGSRDPPEEAHDFLYLADRFAAWVELITPKPLKPVDLRPQRPMA